MRARRVASGFEPCRARQFLARLRVVRRFSLAIAVVACGTLGLAQQPEQRFKSGANVVVVPVVVLDKAGQVVRNLTAEDFSVSEDGMAADVQFFVPPDARGEGADGRLLVLVLDNVNVPPELAWRVKALAGKFVDRMVAGDTLSVIVLKGGHARTSRSQAELRAAIRRYAPSMGAAEAMLDQHRATLGLQAIADLTQQLADATHRRKSLVFIGDTGMFDPREPSAFQDTDGVGMARAPDLSPLWRQVMRDTATNNVSVFAISPFGIRAPGLDAGSELKMETGSAVGAGHYAEGFAEHSGGRAYTRTNDYDRAIDEVWRDSGSYYLIGYDGLADRERHTIDVRVRVPGVTVRARKGR